MRECVVEQLQELTEICKGELSFVNVGGSENRVLMFFRDKNTYDVALLGVELIVEKLRKDGMILADDGYEWIRQNG